MNRVVLSSTGHHYKIAGMQRQAIGVRQTAGEYVTLLGLRVFVFRKRGPRLHTNQERLLTNE